MKRAESGSPAQALLHRLPTCPLVGGQIQRAEPGSLKGHLERAVEFQAPLGFPGLPGNVVPRDVEVHCIGTRAS